MHSTSHVWQPRHYLLNAFFRCGMSHKLCSNQFSNDSKTSLLMNFCRSLKSIWSSLFETRHWLQDKIASPYDSCMRDDDIFRYFLYSFKGRFFFISGWEKMLSAPCFQNCQHVSKLQCTKCLRSTKSNNQKYPHAVPRVTLYIYCMIAREIWRFTPLGKIIFPERNMIFLG